jgi:AcrR family transcriptional regulator
MSRTYTLKKRANRQADTRRRIVDAAIELHGTLGPARTPLTMIADRAGVQRKTLYAHFPDERSLLLACSGTSLERNPLPDAAAWRSIENAEQRLLRGLSDIYEYYDRNSELLGCVLRDAEYHELTGEVASLRYGPGMAKMAEVLGEKLNSGQHPLMHVALSFHTFRNLVQESALEPAAAAEMMTRAVMAGR